MMPQAISHALRMLSSRITLLCTKGTLTRVDDSGPRQKVDFELLKDETDADLERFQQYGFTSHPRPGADLFALYFGGNRDHGIVFNVEDRRFRLANLEQGDSAQYDDREQSIILHKDGITVTSAKNVKVVDGHGQEMVMDPTGITIKALNVSIQKPDGAGSEGNLTIAANTATVTATKAVINSGDVNLGGEGGPAVARVGDDVNLSTGKIITGSTNVKAT